MPNYFLDFGDLPFSSSQSYAKKKNHYFKKDLKNIFYLNKI